MAGYIFVDEDDGVDSVIDEDFEMDIGQEGGTKGHPHMDIEEEEQTEEHHDIGENEENAFNDQHNLDLSQVNEIAKQYFDLIKQKDRGGLSYPSDSLYRGMSDSIPHCIFNRI